jgi:prepilin-type N-terminal cleavage/methylation domain-containing protein
MKKFFKKIENEKGFTLVELLVSAAIFSILILASTGIFVKIMNVQKKALAIQEVQDNISYTMEMISKEIRMMSEITTKNTASDTLVFKNSKEEDIVYSLISEQLTRKKGIEIPQAITSVNVDVIELTFYVNNWDIVNGPQPMVTINLVMEISDGNFGKAQARLQTTLSGRIYEN